MRWIIVLLLFLFCIFPASEAQTWLTHHYNAMSGLPESNVKDILQDRSGRIWAITGKGVSCYDGVEWETYSTPDGLPEAEFLKLAAGPRGRIWVLAIVSNKKALVVNRQKDRTWKTIAVLDCDNYGTVDFTTFLVTGAREGAVVWIGTLPGGVFRWQKGVWRQISTAQGLPDNRVRGIVNLENRFIIGTSKGLAAVAPDGSLQPEWSKGLELPAPEILGIAVEYKDKYPDYPLPHSRIWLMGRRWAGYLENRRFILIPPLPQGDMFWKISQRIKILPDYRRGLYAGNLYKCHYYDFSTRNWEIVGVGNGLIDGSVNAAIIDFERNTWIASGRGITKIVGRHLAGFQARHGLLEDEVTVVVEYRPGKFVFGHNNGITFYDGSRFRRFPVSSGVSSGISPDRIMDIKVDSRGNFWLAMSWAGLVRLDPNGNLERYHLDEETGFLSSLYLNDLDNLWIGSDRGIFILRDGRLIPTKLGRYKPDSARRIIGDRHGPTAIVNHKEGVFIKEPGGWKNYRAADYHRANNVYSIIKDSRGRWIIGTSVGVFILRDGKISPFHKGDIDISTPVYFILEDPLHRLWFGTDNGVVRWDGTDVFRYSQREGLVGSETNRAAAIVDSKGQLWFGTDKGVSIYKGAFDNRNAWVPPPRLELLNLETREKTLPLDKTQQLDYDERNVVFHFRGITFLDEGAVRFKYKLEGLDTDWSREVYPFRQMIRYPNLPPGYYRFHLHARNALGRWSEPVVSEIVEVLPPFYRRAWFLILSGAIVLLVLYAVFRIINDRRSATLLEKMVAERTAQLQASEKRYRALFEDSRDMVFTLSRDGRFKDINPAGMRILGYTGEEENGEIAIQDILVYTPEDRDEFWSRVAENGYVKEYEIDLRRKNGEKLTAQVTAGAIYGEDGKIRAVRGIARDVTQTRLLQQQLNQAQKMEAIGTLAGGIAHDFNNILGVITGYVDLSIDELDEGSRLRKNIDQVKIAAQRGKDMVNQILVFSREDSHDFKPIKAAPIIEETLKFLRSSLPAAIEFRQNLKIRDVVINSNPSNIHQVLMNLCTNSAHAMREKGGILEITLDQVFIDEITAPAYNDIKPGSYLRLCVSDTGHGIQPTILRRIFEPYFTTKKQGEGTGMGLAVIHGIVKKHGGEIKVYSEPGKGSTFHVLFPVVHASVEPLKVGDANTDLPMGNESVLLVDDEELLVEVGRQILEKQGYRVTACSDSIEAWEIFREAPGDFDVVITDLIMPGKTGVQLTREIKTIRPEIPVILCTGFSETISARQVKELGVKALLLKPVDKYNLARSTRNALDPI